MKLIFEGWRRFPHSYGVVDQFLCLELFQRPGIELFHRDIPFVFPQVTPGLGDVDFERRLEQIPAAGPSETADATIRFVAPAPIHPAKTGQTLVFCTAEFGIVQPAMVEGSIAKLNASTNLALMTPSQWSRSGMIRGGFDPDKVIVIPHGFDPAIYHALGASRRQQFREQFGWQDDFVFLNCGAMTANKGIFELLKAFAAVVRDFPPARLVLKGLDAVYPSSRSLQEYKRALSQDDRNLIEPRLTYIGKTMTYAQTAELYQAADAYVAPYKAEAFNIPVLEAAACGLPIICTAGGSTDEFTDPSFCLRIPSILKAVRMEDIPGACQLEPDQPQLVELMRRTLTDASWIAQSRVTSPEYVASRFTWKHAADQLLKVLGDPHAACWRAHPAKTISSSAKELEPEAIYQLGVIALEANKADEALRHFHHAALIQPDEAMYVGAMGEGYRMLGQSKDAIEAFRAATQLNPGLATAHNALGEVLLDGGDAAASLDSFRFAISARPTYERAHMNLGRALHALGKLDEAVASLREAVRLNPKYAIAHNNLGAVLLAQGKGNEAAASLRAAIAIRPNYPEAHFNLGNALHAGGDAVAAATELQEAIRLRPNYARAHAQLGKAIFDLGQVAASVQIFQTALSHSPSDNPTRLRLGEALRLLGRLKEAESTFEQALKAQPDSAEAFAHRFRVRQELCEWDGREQEMKRLRDDAGREIASGQAASLHPLHVMSLPWTGAEQLKIARSYAKEFEKVAERHPSRPAAPRPGSRLKIGYLSRDFYDHPVGHLIHRLFGLHDRDRIEAHAYSFGPNDSSIYRQNIEAGCECFHDVTGLSLTDLDRRIRDDGIQILVDLMGYTGMARTACLALRPAPIQISWLGFAGTMGASFIDYLIADDIVVPAAGESDFREKIIRLPNSFMITDNQQPIAENKPSRRDQGLPENAVVFCCFNNAPKIEPTIFSIWMEILKRSPGSVAWLSVRDAVAQTNLRREATARGVDGARLIFAKHVKSKADHLARLGLADLFLDTHYYNAHATTADALWAGSPILTCPGQTFASRVAASVVTAAGLPELVVPNLDAYKAEAIRLASDGAALRSIREKLQSARTTAPLFDTPRFVRELENAYERLGSANA